MNISMMAYEGRNKPTVLDGCLDEYGELPTASVGRMVVVGGERPPVILKHSTDRTTGCNCFEELLSSDTLASEEVRSRGLVFQPKDL